MVKCKPRCSSCGMLIFVKDRLPREEGKSEWRIQKMQFPADDAELIQVQFSGYFSETPGCPLPRRLRQVRREMYFSIPPKRDSQISKHWLPNREQPKTQNRTAQEYFFKCGSTLIPCDTAPPNFIMSVGVLQNAAFP